MNYHDAGREVAPRRPSVQRRSVQRLSRPIVGSTATATGSAIKGASRRAPEPLRTSTNDRRKLRRRRQGSDRLRQGIGPRRLPKAPHKRPWRATAADRARRPFRKKKPRPGRLTGRAQRASREGARGGKINSRAHRSAHEIGKLGNLTKRGRPKAAACSRGAGAAQKRPRR